MPELSVVVPIYGAPESLEELVERIAKTMENMQLSYEIVLVDDACPKGSWQIIQSLVETSPHIVGIRFARNFGQHIAITAGLKRSRGKLVVVMDGDLQDQPEEIPKLYEALTDDLWYVVAHRTARQDSFWKLARHYP